MSDVDFRIEHLQKALASEKEVLAVISCSKNHAELRERIARYEADILKLTNWKIDQQKIRIQTAYDNGAPCGSA